MSKFYAEKQNDYPDIGQDKEQNPYAPTSNSFTMQINPPKATICLHKAEEEWEILSSWRTAKAPRSQDAAENAANAAQ